jgi:hypothetical protein
LPLVGHYGGGTLAGILNIRDGEPPPLMRLMAFDHRSAGWPVPMGSKACFEANKCPNLVRLVTDRECAMAVRRLAETNLRIANQEGIFAS